MKKPLFIALACIGLGLFGCDQNQQGVSPDASTTTTPSSARLASDSAGFFCKQKITKIETSALPAAVTEYISKTYTGATIEYAAKDDQGNFLVAITQKGEKKALLFNADGSFNEALALKGDRKRGPHGGGGKKGSLTQIAVTDLPATITSYINTNYAGAEIKTAAKDSTRGYIVMIVLDQQPKTLLFNNDGTFNKEVQKPVKGNFTAVAVADLPASVTSYVTTNYANSTIKQAAKNADGQIAVWVQPAGGRPVVLLFNADGTFKQVVKERH
ncbi:PepSY-like domain-containing protein [Larkinella soli]|uniref:PepSY-like domain-containing protein n=1 Tax=Larkinella soli TaxID=1770527 RepID=UPI000FFBA0A5|nr:PepSY-like domain-containing protein [Larkinella soli]